MANDWQQRLAEIDWSKFRTAYGVATDVPAQLRRLRSENETEALAASHDLWCGLCHQHVQIGSAALPALPFLFEVFPTASEQLKVELLDILLGFAICTNPNSLAEFAKSWGLASSPHDQWIADVRTKLVAESPQIVSLRNHPNPEIADFSRRIIEELAVTEGSVQSDLAKSQTQVRSFEETTNEFVRFVVAQGFPPNLLWINRTEVVVSKRRGESTEFVWKGNPTEREREARAVYQQAVTRHIGLCFEARSKTASWTLCRIYVPLDDRDNELRMIPRTGVKYSVTDHPLPAILVENTLQWRWLNLRKRNKPDFWD